MKVWDRKDNAVKTFTVAARGQTRINEDGKKIEQHLWRVDLSFAQYTPRLSTNNCLLDLRFEQIFTVKFFLTICYGA